MAYPPNPMLTTMERVGREIVSEARNIERTLQSLVHLRQQNIYNLPETADGIQVVMAQMQDAVLMYTTELGKIVAAWGDPWDAKQAPDNDEEDGGPDPLPFDDATLLDDNEADEELPNVTITLSGHGDPLDDNEAYATIRRVGEDVESFMQRTAR